MFKFKEYVLIKNNMEFHQYMYATVQIVCAATMTWYGLGLDDD